MTTGMKQPWQDRTAMTALSGQDIWDITTGVTMGQDSPDRSVLIGQTGQDRDDTTART
jgi:hypothetical protein